MSEKPPAPPSEPHQTPATAEEPSAVIEQGSNQFLAAASCMGITVIEMGFLIGVAYGSHYGLEWVKGWHPPDHVVIAAELCELCLKWLEGAFVVVSLAVSSLVIGWHQWLEKKTPVRPLWNALGKFFQESGSATLCKAVTLLFVFLAGLAKSNEETFWMGCAIATFYIAMALVIFLMITAVKNSGRTKLRVLRLALQNRK